MAPAGNCRADGVFGTVDGMDGAGVPAGNLSADASTRSFNRAVLRGDVRWLEREGLFDEIVSRVSPETAALMRNPLEVAWVAGHQLDELLDAVADHGGGAALERLALETTRASFGPVVSPLLKLATTLLGGSPASVFKRADSVCGPLIRGVTFEYEEQSPRSGVVRLTTADVPSPRWFQTWVGTLCFAFEVCQAKGTVESWRILPGGRVAEFQVSWED